MKVLITHPGRQHSHQAALALAGEEMLAGYWAGVPALARHGRRVPARLRRRFLRYAPIDLPPELSRWTPWVPALRRFGDGLGPELAARTDLLACRLFDRWAAARLRRGMADAVMACEISALSTFRKARRLGMATLLDAAATHHATQDRHHGYSEPPALHRRIVAVKDEEIALADHILVVSELARRSYLEAGVPEGKLHLMALGVETSLFAPPEADGEPGSDGAGVEMLFAGAASRVKGFDLLLSAFERVHGELPEVRLSVVGPPGDASPLSGSPTPDGVALFGSLPQSALASRLRGADLLVLPSRNESFGMVVPEALACGLPVVVSDRVGAADLVRDGENGWVVPAGDADALAARLLACARDRTALRAMRPACIESAAAADWSVYRRRLPRLLSDLLRDLPSGVR